jgi:hypothetical protein
MILPHHKTFLSQLAKIAVKNFLDNYEKLKEERILSGNRGDNNLPVIPDGSDKSVQPVLTNS